MRIDGWHIDGFGVHADLHVSDLPSGLTIVAGPNESGKTTIQHFLVGMLFGFPPVNRADHHAPLYGGAYGGRLFVTTEDGTHLTIHRGARRSSLKVTHADGTPFEGDLATVVGGASKELFQSIFSVHLSDLAELQALTSDEVRDRVFSAGIVGAGRSAQGALAQLSGERDALLKPSGRGDRYRIKELRAQLAEARLRLDEARRESQSLPAHLRQQEQLEGRAATLGTEADRLRGEIHLLTAVADLWPRWSAGTEARHQLDQLGAITAIPADGAQRLHTSIGHHHSADEAALAAANELIASRAALAAVEAPVIEVDVLDEIDRLARLCDAERDRAVRIDELVARAIQQRAELDAELAILGPDHDLAWLQTRPTGASDASGLRQAAAAVGDARTDRRDATRAAEQLATDLSVEAAELDRSDAALADLPTLRPADALAGLDAAAALAALATQREVAARRLAEAEARRASPTAATAASSSAATVSLAGAAAALVAGIVLLATGQVPAGAAILVTAAVLTTVSLLGRSRTATAATTPDVDAVIELATEDLRHIDAELVTPLAILHLDATPSAAAAAALRTHADRLAASAQQAHDQRRRAGEDRERHTDRARRLEAAARQRVESAAARVQAAEAGWSTWLRDHDLPCDLDPAGAAEFLGAVDRARATARGLSVTEADLAAQRSAATTFAAAVRTLGTALADAGEPAPDPLVLIDRLARIAAQQRALHQAAAEAEAALERAAVAERRAGRAKAQAAERLALDLQLVGARTIDDALATIERAAAAAGLQATIDDADARLEAALGTAAEARSRALDLLTTADPEGLRAQATELRRSLAQINDDRDECLHTQAAVRAEILDLMTSADVPRAELRVAGIEAELVDAVTAWASLTLAHQMVEGTLAKYQRERQPDVVRRAGVLFQHITDGAYIRLEVRENDVFTIEHTGREVPANGLSQGTTEQLYLCMRIALAESFAQTTALPLLLDDITVNADPRRQQQLNELIATVSDSQQVFAFTCHDTVVDQLRQLRPDARVLTLEAHRVPAQQAEPGANGITLAAG